MSKEHGRHGPQREVRQVRAETAPEITFHDASPEYGRTVVAMAGVVPPEVYRGAEALLKDCASLGFEGPISAHRFKTRALQDLLSLDVLTRVFREQRIATNLFVPASDAQQEVPLLDKIFSREAVGIHAGPPAVTDSRWIRDHFVYHDNSLKKLPEWLDGGDLRIMGDTVFIGVPTLWKFFRARTGESTVHGKLDTIPVKKETGELAFDCMALAPEIIEHIEPMFNKPVVVPGLAAIVAYMEAHRGISPFGHFDYVHLPIDNDTIAVGSVARTKAVLHDWRTAQGGRTMNPAREPMILECNRLDAFARWTGVSLDFSFIPDLSTGIDRESPKEMLAAWALSPTFLFERFFKELDAHGYAAVDTCLDAVADDFASAGKRVVRVPYMPQPYDSDWVIGGSALVSYNNGIADDRRVFMPTYGNGEDASFYTYLDRAAAAAYEEVGKDVVPLDLGWSLMGSGGNLRCAFLEIRQ